MSGVGWTQLRAYREPFKRIVDDTHQMVNEHRAKLGMPPIDWENKEPRRMELTEETGAAQQELCGCGKPRHRGMCSYRAAKAAATRAANAGQPMSASIPAHSFLKDQPRRRGVHPVVSAIDSEIASMETNLSKLRRARQLVEGLLA